MPKKKTEYIYIHQKKKKKNLSPKKKKKKKAVGIFRLRHREPMYSRVELRFINAYKS